MSQHPEIAHRRQLEAWPSQRLALLLHWSLDDIISFESFDMGFSSEHSKVLCFSPFGTCEKCGPTLLDLLVLFSQALRIEAKRKIGPAAIASLISRECLQIIDSQSPDWKIKTSSNLCSMQFPTFTNYVVSSLLPNMTSLCTSFRVGRVHTLLNLTWGSMVVRRTNKNLQSIRFHGGNDFPSCFWSTGRWQKESPGWRRPSNNSIRMVLVSWWGRKGTSWKINGLRIQVGCKDIWHESWGHS